MAGLRQKKGIQAYRKTWKSLIVQERDKNGIQTYRSTQSIIMVAGLRINRSFRLALSIRLLFEKTAANANSEKLLSGLPLV